MKEMNSALEPLHHLVIDTSKFTEFLCFLLEDSDDRVSVVAIYETKSQLVFEQVHACLALELIDCRLK
jgi:hypothetical protein